MDLQAGDFYCTGAGALSSSAERAGKEESGTGFNGIRRSE